MKPPKAQIIWLLKLFSIFEKRKEKMIYNTKTKKPFSPNLQVEFLISMGRPRQRRPSLWWLSAVEFNHKSGYKPCDLL